MSKRCYNPNPPPSRAMLDVQASIRIGPLRFDRVVDKLRIAVEYAGGDDREVALLDSSEMLKLKLWLNGDL